jgi:hypothetical protein
MVGPEGIEGDQDQVRGRRFPPAAAEPKERPDPGKEERSRKAFFCSFRRRRLWKKVRILSKRLQNERRLTTIF